MDTLTPNYQRQPDGTGRTRRPMGHKVEPDGPDPVTPVRTWLFREDAQVAADELKQQGWIARVQYIGAWMRWTVWAKRKSWGYTKAERILHADGTLGPSQ